MPRRHRRRTDPRSREPHRPPATTPIPAPDGWQAERYRGGEPGADYVCPRCKRGVRRGSEHVVAWRSEDEGVRGSSTAKALRSPGRDGRHRHWHTNCWTSAVREGIEKYRWA